MFVAVSSPDFFVVVIFLVLVGLCANYIGDSRNEEVVGSVSIIILGAMLIGFLIYFFGLAAIISGCSMFWVLKNNVDVIRRLMFSMLSGFFGASLAASEHDRFMAAVDGSLLRAEGNLSTLIVIMTVSFQYFLFKYENINFSDAIKFFVSLISLAGTFIIGLTVFDYLLPTVIYVIDCTGYVIRPIGIEAVIAVREMLATILIVCFHRSLFKFSSSKYF